MPKVNLWQLAQSGATTGQAPVWNGTEYAPGDVSGGSSLGWFNVKDYGALGDGTTDDTSAINAAIAALNTAGRGVLYFPAGTYKCTSALTAITAHAHIRGDGAGDLQAQNAASTLKITATTGYLMTLAGDGTTVEALAFENPTTTTQTAGAAIRVTQGDLNRYRNISVRGFYDCIDIEDGVLWAMEDCYLVGPVRYGLYIRHIDLPDGGDWTIVGGGIYAEDRTGTAAIRQESGGGGRITGLKVNTLYGTAYFGKGLDIEITNAATTNLIIEGCSSENITGQHVYVTHTGTGSFGHVQIGPFQTAHYQSGTTPAMEFSNVSLVEVDNLIHVANPTRSSVEAIKFTSVDTIRIGQRIVSGYSTDYMATSCTDVVDTTAGSGGVPTSRQVATGTGLTGGGDLTADRTLSIDTSAEAERIRDVIGTALVEGLGIDITVDDSSDTITIAATGSATTRLTPMTTTIGGGDPQLVFTENGEVLMVEVPA